VNDNDSELCSDEESICSNKKSSSKDFCIKINNDFDLHKAYEESVLKILNAYSREKLT
jgi:hypothetical protein